MIKKILLTLTILLTLGLTTYANTNKISDWAQEEVIQAITEGYVPARLQNNYQKTITREEFAELFVNMIFEHQWQFGIEYPNLGIPEYRVTKEEFLNSIVKSDVNFQDTDAEHVMIAYYMGMVNGTSATTFHPNNPITRQEAAVMLINYWGTRLSPNYVSGLQELGDLDKTASWAKDHVLMAYGHGFFKGTREAKFSTNYDRVIQKALFSPTGNFTREQAIVIAQRIFSDWKFGKGLMVRGFVPYNKLVASYQFEITKDSVRALYNIDHPSLVTMVEELNHLRGKQYGMITSERAFAIEQGQGFWGKGIFKDIVYKRALESQHTIFDVGYMEVEIFNPEYLFEYRFNPNRGVFNVSLYGGRDYKYSTFTLLESTSYRHSFIY
ncbi:S-layer family protein [Natranaerovirga pectinivora]|uniref:S-layer family protein n=1 Tax=Natranaerovirga pectinivora TaxID=682400 RepID=A0A4R3MP30_9FIRM|nr:S-layer homology domain-containing protein [Natranaerovirga pectinivora]TCT14574.1 S-layer family protein [Natranaerovirga pectinivora]